MFLLRCQMASEFETIFTADNMVPATNMQQPPVNTETVVPPVTTDPPATQEPPVTTIPDPVKLWVKEKFGTENPDEVVTGYQSLADLRKKSEESEGYQKRALELETQYKQLAEKPTYQSDFAKKADEIFKLTGGKATRETIARFYDLNPADLKGEEALDLIKQIESPTLTAEERGILRGEEYGVSDELGLTEGQKIQRKDKFEQDVTKARERLAQLASKAFEPINTHNQPTPQEIEAEQTRVGFWQQNTDKIDSSIFKRELPFKLKVPNGKGGIDEIDQNLSYAIPDDKKQQIFSAIAKEITNPANAQFFTSDTAGIERANTYAKSIVNNAIIDDLQKAYKVHYDTAVSNIHEHYSKLLNNTDFLNAVQSPSSGKAGVIDYNKSVEEYLQRTGS